MELVTWSDGKLEERLERIDKDFTRVDERLFEINARVSATATETETNRRFDEVNRRITEGREETNNRFDRVEGDIAELRAKLDRITIGLVLGFPAVIATVVAKGG